MRKIWLLSLRSDRSHQWRLFRPTQPTIYLLCDAARRLGGRPQAEQATDEQSQINPLLAENPQPDEFRRYRCGQTVCYDIAFHREASLTGCQLLDALGGGPRLLPELTEVEEGFVDFANSKIIRDPLGSKQPNARSAIGITRDGSVLVVMVAQKPEVPTTSGLSLPTLAAFMKA